LTVAALKRTAKRVVLSHCQPLIRALATGRQKALSPPAVEAEKMNSAVLTNTFEPRELAFLKRVFDGICAERGLTGESLAANDLAAQIIQLYQQGIRNEKELEIQLDGGEISKF
jgi:hypothetical protein